MVSDAVSPTVTTEQPTAQQPKKRQKRVNYALAGALLSQGLEFDEIAPQVGAANGESLRAGMSRKGVTKKSVMSLQPRETRVTTVTAKIVDQASAVLADRFNGEIARQLAQIEAQPCSYDDLPSRGQGRTATVKTLAETYRAVNGNPDSVTFSFGASVQSSRPELETPQQVANCGAEQTQAIDITPQDDVKP